MGMFVPRTISFQLLLFPLSIIPLVFGILGLTTSKKLFEGIPWPFTAGLGLQSTGIIVITMFSIHHWPGAGLMNIALCLISAVMVVAATIYILRRKGNTRAEDYFMLTIPSWAFIIWLGASLNFGTNNAIVSTIGQYDSALSLQEAIIALEKQVKTAEIVEYEKILDIETNFEKEYGGLPKPFSGAMGKSNSEFNHTKLDNEMRVDISLVLEDILINQYTFQYEKLETSTEALFEIQKAKLTVLTKALSDLPNNQ